MLTHEEWDFGFVLPNLVLPSDIEDSSPGAFPHGISIAADCMLIVPGDHAAVRAIRARSSAADHILSSFYNQHGHPYSPAVLILRKTLSDPLKRSLDAIIALRNSIALAVILRGRADTAHGGGATAVTWSDTFDFHPAQVSGNGKMILQSPALRSLVSSSARLTLTHSPFVTLEGRRLWPDHYLLHALGRAWRRRFTPQPRANAFASRAFRSLEVAYQACAVGGKNEASLHEYGSQIAMWVSALEILAWPTKKRADLLAVLALLDRYPGGAAIGRQRYRAKIRGAFMRLTALQRAYVYLNRARNNFLHGNPVSADDMLVVGKTHQVALPRIAALVYRAALVAYLIERYPRATSARALRTRAMEGFDDSAFESAVADAFGYESTDD